MISLLLALGAAAGRQSSPSLNEQQKINQAATSVALNMVANMKIPEDGSRARRAIQTQYTNCAACLDANFWWNGFYCSDTTTYSVASVALWGAGYETDCSKNTGITTMTDYIKCGEDEENPQDCTENPTTGSQTVFALYIKIAIPSAFTYSSDHCAILDQATVDITGSKFSASKGQDDPGFPYLDQKFARIEKGKWSTIARFGCPGASEAFTYTRSLTALDSYYRFDNVACPNGVNAATSGCTPADLTGWHEFKEDDFRLTSTEQAANNVMRYTFCYVASPTYGCIHVHLPSFIKSGTTGDPGIHDQTVAKNENSFNCGGRSHSLGLLDIEWAFDLRGINYETSNTRYGFRMLNTQQTGTIVVTDEEDDNSNDELKSKSGFVILDLEKSMLYDDAGSEATCSSPRDANMLKYSKTKLEIVGSSTSCGASTIFNQAWKSSTESKGFDNILCHFASFLTSNQNKNILWDPKNSIDANLAASAASSQNGGSGSGSNGAHSVAPALAAFAAAIFLSLLA